MSFNNNSLRFPPGFGHGRGHGQSAQAPELGGGIYAGWGSGQGRETIGGFPVGQGLQGPGGLIAGGLEGGDQDASMRKYLGGGGGELARVGKEDCHELLIIWGEVIMGLVVIWEEKEEEEDHIRMFSRF